MSDIISSDAVGESAIVASEEFIVAAQQLKDTREALSQLRSQEDQLKKKLWETLGESSAAYAPDGRKVLHVQVSHRRGVDAARLEAMHPDVYAAVETESEIKSLKIDV